MNSYWILKKGVKGPLEREEGFRIFTFQTAGLNRPTQRFMKSPSYIVYLLDVAAAAAKAVEASPVFI